MTRGSAITGRCLNRGRAFRIVTANFGITMSSRGNGFMRVILLLRGGAIALSAALWNACTGGGMRQSGGGFLNPNKEYAMKALRKISVKAMKGGAVQGISPWPYGRWELVGSPFCRYRL